MLCTWLQTQDVYHHTRILEDPCKILTPADPATPEGFCTPRISRSETSLGAPIITGLIASELRLIVFKLQAAHTSALSCELGSEL